MPADSSVKTFIPKSTAVLPKKILTAISSNVNTTVKTQIRDFDICSFVPKLNIVTAMNAVITAVNTSVKIISVYIKPPPFIQTSDSGCGNFYLS